MLFRLIKAKCLGTEYGTCCAVWRQWQEDWYTISRVNLKLSSLCTRYVDRQYRGIEKSY